MSWYLKVLRNYAVFSGRARRKEYWMFVLFNVIFGGVAVVIDNAIGSGEPSGVVSGLYSLAVVIPSIAVTVRRLHDVGKSGWWILIAIVPLIGSIWLLVLLASDSEPGENQYGPNPKGVPAEMAAFGGERRGTAAGTDGDTPVEALRQLRTRVATLSDRYPASGQMVTLGTNRAEIQIPWICRTLKEAADALETKRDPFGNPITRGQVIAGLTKLTQMVEEPSYTTQMEMAYPGIGKPLEGYMDELKSIIARLRAAGGDH